MRVNDLLESVLSPELRVARSSADRAAAKQLGLAPAPVTLDDLFARELCLARPTRPSSSTDTSTPASLSAAPSPTLPVDLHFTPTPQPTLSLSFPSPHTPPYAAFPITLTLSAGPDGLIKVLVNVSDTEEGRQAKERLEGAGLERVVARTSDLGLLMRAVGRGLLAS